MNKFAKHYLNCKKAAEESKASEPAAPAPLPPPILPKPGTPPILKPAAKFNMGDPLQPPKIIRPAAPAMPPAAGALQRA